MIIKRFLIIASFIAMAIAGNGDMLLTRHRLVLSANESSLNINATFIESEETI
jgi:hypothetical protein